MEFKDPRIMETESIPRLLARFAGPAIVGMIASALYNIVDRIFVGQTVGANGIAAIALGFPLMLFFFSFALLVGVGGGSRIAILLGAGEVEKAEKTLGNAVFICLVIGVFFLVFSRAFIDPILRVSGASENLLPMARSYLSIVLWGVFFAIFSFAFSSFIRAAGSPGYAMGTQVIGAVVNVLLDAWFVLGLGKGVEGAAVATVISQGISMCWATGYFLLPGSKLKLMRVHVSTPHWPDIKRILMVGLPPCLVELNFVLIHALMNVGVQRDGGDLAVSATGIFMSLDSLLFMPAIAIGEGAQPIIGYNYGAKKIDRVIQTIKLALGATTLFYMISFLLIQTNAEALVRLFNRSDPALIALAALAMRIANIGIPLMGISIITSFTLQGLGRAREGLFLSFIRFGVLLIIPLLVLPRIFGLYGNWAAFPVSDIAGSAISAVFLYCLIQKLKSDY